MNLEIIKDHESIKQDIKKIDELLIYRYTVNNIIYNYNCLVYAKNWSKYKLLVHLEEIKLLFKSYGFKYKPLNRMINKLVKNKQLKESLYYDLIYFLSCFDSYLKGIIYNINLDLFNKKQENYIKCL